MSSKKSGTVRRKGSWVAAYTREDGTRVKGHYRKSTTIRDTGERGRTPKNRRVLPELQRGTLGAFGYSDIKNKTAVQRHRALGKAVRSEGYAPVIRKLTAISNYNRNTNPRVRELIERDKRWMRRELADKYALTPRSRR